MFKSINRTDDDFLPPKKKEEMGEENDHKIAKCLKGVDHRFTMHVSMDKHQYKPGETVHIRGILLNEFTHEPAMKRFGEETFNFRIIGPNGSVVLGGDDVTTPGHKKSVIAVDWNVPQGQIGGTYKVEIGKQYYEEKEMKKDEEETEGEYAAEPGENFIFAPGSAATMQVEDSSITKVGRNGWNGLVKLEVKNRDSQKFKVRVDHANNDRSGMFIGIIGANTKKNEIWKSASFTDLNRNPEPGNVYEIEVRDRQNTMVFSMNGTVLAERRQKISNFKRPLYLGVFQHYKGNKVTVLGETRGGFFPISTRTFDILNYQPPKFKMNLEFPKKGYSSGELVKAELKVERSEGGAPEKCDIEATARVDGEEVFRKSYVCTTGMQAIEFELPKEIVGGNGTLNCSVTEGVTENVSKTIPIILRKLDCKVFPEGGELVYGCPCGVYVEAKTLYGSPADFAGFVMEQSEEDPSFIKPVVEVKTVHEGRGSFVFTPKRGNKYFIKVLQPMGITVPVEFPEIKDVGLTIRLPLKSSVPFGTPIDIILSASRELETKIGLFKKEKVVQMSEVFALKAGEEKLVKLDPKDVDGVLRMTAYFINSGFGVTTLDFPIAERLIMVKPRGVLNFDIEAEKLVYSPGETAKLKIRPKLLGKPVNSIICCTVTDDTVIQMQDKRKRPPRLVEQVYLENEVKSLKDCTSYIYQEEGNKVPPDTCCDLLLGTQGWRRFVYKFVDKNKKFYELEQYKKTDKQFFFRMLNLPNPEYLERKEAMKKKLEELKKKQEEQLRIVPTASYGRKGGRGGRRYKTKRKMKKKSKGGGGGMFFDSAVLRATRSSTSMNQKESLSRAVPKSGRSWGRGRGRGRGGGRGRGRSINMPPPPMRAQREMAVMMGEEEEEEDEKMEIAIQPAKAKKSSISVFGKRSRRRMPRRPPRSDQYLGFIAPVEPPKVQLKVVQYAREYAHSSKVPGKKPGERTDFTETVFFSPYRETSYNSKSKSYETEIQFDLSDSISSFVVRIDAFSLHGAVGSSNSFMLKVQKPFYITPKLPLELSMADEVRVPVGIVNNLPLKSKAKVSWDAKGTQIVFQNPEWTGEVEANQRKVEYFNMKVNSAYVDQEKQVLTVQGDMEDFRMTDVVKKEIGVKPYGFLTCEPFSGTIQKGEERVWEFAVPEGQFVPFSMETVGFVTPSSLGTLLSATKGLIREPYGCFEQVSSTMYPMIMAKQFLMNQNQPMDSKIERFLKKGYDKLVGYEIRGGGFDWYGRAPANESLSAMGLVQFIELSKCFSIDPNVIDRTRKWLLSRRKNETFRRGSGRYAYGHAKPHTTNAYIVWSLSRSGCEFKDVEKIITHLHKNAVTMQNRKNDNYVTALLSMSYYNFEKYDEAAQLARLLLQEQTEDGSFKNCLDTMTRSGGRNRYLECTALSTLAMMNFDDEAGFQEYITKSIDFIMKNNKCGCYGSTQATVLCLQTVVKYFGSSQDSDGKVDLEVNGAVVSSLSVPKHQNRRVDFGDFRRNVFTDGKMNKIVLRSDYGSNLPFSLACWFKISVPPFDLENFSFNFDTKIRSERIKEGDTTEIEVVLENKKEDEEQPMIVAIVAIPSGLTVRMEKLKELQKQEKFAYFELFGARNVVFYWRGMQPKEKVQFAFDVSASIPGKYIGDASRAYLYYDNDERYYVKGLQVEIDTNQ